MSRVPGGHFGFVPSESAHNFRAQRYMKVFVSHGVIILSRRGLAIERREAQANRFA